jgi:cystathionine beta-synthase
MEVGPLLRPEERKSDFNTCKWALGSKEKSPHPCIPPPERKKIYDSALELIGNTPTVRLHTIPQSMGIKAEILVKCEFMNAGGSVKDRIGYRMVMDAELSGRIKPGDVLIEPTSGNTGIGMALAAALRGYKMIITMPEKMSQEKVNMLKALGAQIIRTPTEAAWNSPESHISVALRLKEEIPNSHILDQYSNPANPLAHYDGTGTEILRDTDGKLDAVVIGAGTGGTITGIARRVKEHNPNILVVGVDPFGSILALPDSLNDKVDTYQVEGVGYDFIPRVLDRSVVDRWVKTDDKSSFRMARRLIKEEGLFVGGSSGANLCAALEIAKDMHEGQRVVVILPDSVRNYMTKFLSDDWMIMHDFMDEEETISPETRWWANKQVRMLELATPCTVLPDLTCGKAVEILRTEGYDQLPVIDRAGTILGVVTEGNLLARMASGKLSREDPVSKVLYRQFKTVSLDTKLGKLSKIFDRDHFAIVTASQQSYSQENEEPRMRFIIIGVVSRVDLLNFIVRGEK